jgi:hypothetical protein
MLPDNRKLTREQARFIVYVLTYDLVMRKKRGFKIRSRGIHVRLARKFNVSTECIIQIAKRRTWRKLRCQPKRHLLID